MNLSLEPRNLKAFFGSWPCSRPKNRKNRSFAKNSQTFSAVSRKHVETIIVIIFVQKIIFVCWELFQKSARKVFHFAKMLIIFRFWNTYGTVHMPTAHMSTDGCEALSAFSRWCMKRKIWNELWISQLIPFLETKFRADSEFDDENCRCHRFHCEIFQNRKMISIFAKWKTFFADFSNNSQQTKMIFCTKIITILVSKCPRETAGKVWKVFAKNRFFQFFGRQQSQLCENFVSNS